MANPISTDLEMEAFFKALAQSLAISVQQVRATVELLDGKCRVTLSTEVSDSDAVAAEGATIANPAVASDTRSTAVTMSVVFIGPSYFRRKSVQRISNF